MSIVFFFVALIQHRLGVSTQYLLHTPDRFDDVAFTGTKKDSWV